jgi:hypothetical protein
MAQDWKSLESPAEEEKKLVPPPLQIPMPATQKDFEELKKIQQEITARLAMMTAGTATAHTQGTSHGKTKTIESSRNLICI